MSALKEILLDDFSDTLPQAMFDAVVDPHDEPVVEGGLQAAILGRLERHLLSRSAGSPRSWTS